MSLKDNKDRINQLSKRIDINDETKPNDFEMAMMASLVKAEYDKIDYILKELIFDYDNGKNIKDESGIICAPIGRSEKDRKKMCVTDKNSRNALTKYEVIERFDKFTFVRVTLETGRTHQIRVHMSHIGHPVAGDPVYGPKNGVTSLNGQCLHAGMIGFIHPRDGQYMEFTSELPDYFKQFLKTLKKTAV